MASLLLLLIGCGGGTDVPLRTLSGSLTWEVDFDADAEAVGLSDCSYTRTYEGHEDRSAPWLCPKCDVVFRVDSALSPASCHATISAEAASPVEWLGWSDERFFRASRENFELGRQGDAVLGDGGSRAIANTADAVALDAGGTYTLTVSGTLVEGEGKGDPLWGFGPPDKPECGPERSERPDYDGPWRLAEGRPLPDGFFLDGCGEGVRLHDLLGTWLIVEVGASDCPPCQDMAAGEEAFLAQMADAGTEVRAVTLLAPSLSAVLDPTPARQLDEWSGAFGLSAPVLADRGWGYWMGTDALGGAYGYPMILVVDPDGTVVAIQVGFGTWDQLGALIASR